MKRFFIAAFVAFGFSLPVSAADMSFSTGTGFLPGPRLVDGSDLNVMVGRVNGLSDGTWGFTGDLLPATDGTYDLGSTTLEWQDLWIDGTAEIDSLSINGTAVTATGAELNYLDIASLGTGAVSKAVVLDTNGAFVGPTASTTKWTWNVTSTSTDGGTSVQPFVHTTTMSGIGGVGGRAYFGLSTNVALGSWSNALKGEVIYGASGRTTGLGSSILAEMQLSAGTSAGSYAPLEIELGLATGALTGTRTSFMSINAYGDDAATMDANGYLFDLNGLTAGAGDLFDTTAKTGIGLSGALKIKIGATDYFIPVCTTAACGGS